MSFDCLHGDFVARNAHIRGLQRIIDLRGGTKALGLNGFLEADFNAFRCVYAMAEVQTRRMVEPSYQDQFSNPKSCPCNPDYTKLAAVLIDTVS